MNTHDPERFAEELNQANSCLTMGAGVGAAGAGAAVLTGATCPLCIVIAPALIGIGAWKRYSAKRKQHAESVPTGNEYDLEVVQSDRPSGSARQFRMRSLKRVRSSADGRDQDDEAIEKANC